MARLRDINKDKRAEEGSTGTISERMQPIVGRTAEDIKRCANFCDTYAKQRIVSKIMHSSSWRRELNECIQRLTDRRHEFELALSLYIDHAVSTANHKPSIINEECVLLSLRCGFSDSSLTTICKPERIPFSRPAPLPQITLAVRTHQGYTPQNGRRGLVVGSWSRSGSGINGCGRT